MVHAKRPTQKERQGESDKEKQSERQSRDMERGAEIEDTFSKSRRDRSREGQAREELKGCGTGTRAKDTGDRW